MLCLTYPDTTQTQMQRDTELVSVKKKITRQKTLGWMYNSSVLWCTLKSC